jgi:hypothetical protein
MMSGAGEDVNEECQAIALTTGQDRCTSAYFGDSFCDICIRLLPQQLTSIKAIHG